mmetsp:Transcript_16818/g.38567  ORF Transcript_16818/g.38567 Transcript_16818/m.38567 type:complete len:256 (+) Transcript_16818:539-1306(+)
MCSGRCGRRRRARSGACCARAAWTRPSYAAAWRQAATRSLGSTASSMRCSATAPSIGRARTGRRMRGWRAARRCWRRVRFSRLRWRRAWARRGGNRSTRSHRASACSRRGGLPRRSSRPFRGRGTKSAVSPSPRGRRSRRSASSRAQSMRMCFPSKSRARHAAAAALCSICSCSGHRRRRHQHSARCVLHCCSRECSRLRLKLTGRRSRTRKREAGTCCSCYSCSARPCSALCNQWWRRPSPRLHKSESGVHGRG